PASSAGRACPGAAGTVAGGGNRAGGAQPSAPPVPQRAVPPAQPAEALPGVLGGTPYHAQPMTPHTPRATASLPEPGSRGGPPPEAPHYRSAPAAPPAAPPVPAAPRTSAPPPPPAHPPPHSSPPPARDTSRPQ